MPPNMGHEIITLVETHWFKAMAVVGCVYEEEFSVSQEGKSGGSSFRIVSSYKERIWEKVPSLMKSCFS